MAAPPPLSALQQLRQDFLQRNRMLVPLIDAAVVAKLNAGRAANASLTPDQRGTLSDAAKWRREDHDILVRLAVEADNSMLTAPTVEAVTELQDELEDHMSLLRGGLAADVSCISLPR